MADLGAGIYGVLGVLRALLDRRSGRGGQHLEVSLLDVMLAFSAHVGEDYLLNDRGDEAPRFAAPNGLYPTADEHIALAAYTDEAWRTQVSLDEFSALDVPDFAAAQDRMERRAELDARLAEVLRTRGADAWTTRLSSAGIVVSPIADMGAVFENEHLKARGMLPVIKHPVIGELPALGNPIRIDEGPGSEASEEDIVPAPRHGQDTELVLRDYLGLDEERIADLMARGVVLGLVPEKI
jgi:crotonobetainyl-CoA:carnitine CoA-transferase CaiB-like acyl-CoA transferase